MFRIVLVLTIIGVILAIAYIIRLPGYRMAEPTSAPTRQEVEELVDRSNRLLAEEKAQKEKAEVAADR